MGNTFDMELNSVYLKRRIDRYTVHQIGTAKSTFIVKASDQYKKFFLNYLVI